VIDENNASPAGVARRDLIGVGAGAAVLAVGLGRAAQAQTPAPRSTTPPGPTPPQTASPGTIDVERRGSVMLIGINRPQALNRLDPPMLVGLGKAYYQFEHDDALRVAVLHGVGPNFCMALDVPAYLAAVAAGTYPPKDTDIIVPQATRPPFRTKPVVVAVQGGVWGIGHEMFLASDIRVAASDSRFRQPEVTAGAFPAGGATVRFTREAGWGNAMRYMLTGEEWGADEEYRFGLIQEVTPPGKQLDRAVELADKIAAVAPLGVRATLASANQAISNEAAALQALLPEFQRILQSEDSQEGRRAFRENRKPVFQGR
jgi:enoyl-CoA hydratase/carnithine racemase